MLVQKSGPAQSKFCAHAAQHIQAVISQVCQGLQPHADDHQDSDQTLGHRLMFD